MKKAQDFFIGFIGILCAIYLYLSAQMKFGTLAKPGPGFLPVFLGIAGIIISAALLIGDYLRAKKEPANTKVKEKKGLFEENREGKLRLIGYVVCVILFVPMFKYLGTLISIFLLVFALTKISGTKGYIFPVIFAALTSGIIYVSFVMFLKVTLPRGIFF